MDLKNIKSSNKTKTEYDDEIINYYNEKEKTKIIDNVEYFVCYFCQGFFSNFLKKKI
jgi:hypothetical protein